MSWSTHDILQLINEFRKQELLWNPVAQKAGSCEARKASWNHIANVFQKPVHEIRRKVGSLLSSYRKTRIDEQKGLHPFRKTWKFYKYLSFMNNRPKVRISYRKGCAKKTKGANGIGSAVDGNGNAGSGGGGVGGSSSTMKSYKYENDESNSQVIDIGSEQSNESYPIDDGSHLDFNNFNSNHDYEDDMKLDEFETLPQQETFFPQQNPRQADLGTIPQQETFFPTNSFQNEVTPSTIIHNQNDYILNTSLLPPPPPPQSSSSLNNRSNVDNSYSYAAGLNHSSPPVPALHQFKSSHKNNQSSSSIFGSEPSQTSEPSLQLFRPVPKDECDAYGDYVAFKLRCYPDKIKNLVQNSINNIIFKADMGKI